LAGRAPETGVLRRKILADRLIVTVASGDSVPDQQVYVTKPRLGGPPATFFAAVLGSRFIAFFVRSFYDEANDAFPQIKVKQLRELPIPFLDENASMGQRAERVSELVRTLLARNASLASLETEHAKTLLRRQIAATDREIDALVYELYGLTDEEIAIVEAATGGD